MSNRRLGVCVLLALLAGYGVAILPSPAIAQGAVTISRIVGWTFTAGHAEVDAYIKNGSVIDFLNRAIVVGCVAHDADGTGCYPVITGGIGSTAVPAAVSADGDSTRKWLTRNGVDHVISTAGTPGTPNPVADSATNVTLMAANAARLGLKCTNTSTAVLYLKFGATATTTSFSVPIAAGGYYNAEWPVPTSIVDGIWATDPNTGSSICQEFTQ